MNSEKIYKPTITINISDMKLRIIRIGKSTNMKKWADGCNEIRPVHSHFTFEVIFVTNGSLTVRTQEKITFYEKKIVIIPPEIGHYTVPDDDGCFCVLFSIEGSKGSDARAKYLNHLLQKDICEFELSEDVAYYIRAFSRKSDENNHSAEKDAALLAELIFREIVSLLISSSVPETTKSEEWYVGTIETYINSHIDDKITLSDIAKHVYLSNKQVSRIIMREFGMHLSDLVTEKKLQNARMFLKNTDIKVKDIAAKVNLGGENYFYTLFKKKYGMSPLEYRNSCREK